MLHTLNEIFTKINKQNINKVNINNNPTSTIGCSFNSLKLIARTASNVAKLIERINKYKTLRQDAIPSTLGKR